MSFINKCQAAWDQPLGSAIEDFKDLSKTQKATVILLTTIAAAAVITIPLAIVTFRSLVGRCTEYNDEQNEQQIAMVLIGEKNETIGEKNEAFEWIKNKYENSKSANKDLESMTYEIETFEPLYNFVKKNPSYQDHNFNNIIRRINLQRLELGRKTIEYLQR
jgi:hypothetical protein